MVPTLTSVTPQLGLNFWFYYNVSGLQSFDNAYIKANLYCLIFYWGSDTLLIDLHDKHQKPEGVLQDYALLNALSKNLKKKKCLKHF